MSSAPVITIRSNLTPYGVLSSLVYAQSTLGGDDLPVLQGEVSNKDFFRVYNNWARAAGIASAINVGVVVFDGIGVYTASTTPVAQSWVRVYETAFGENSTTPGQEYSYTGNDTAIGGTPAGANQYDPEVGSNGSASPIIRAGTDTNGVGFIEFATYAQLPEVVAMASYSFAVTIQYEWSS